jgi:hypothetical protein
MVIQILRRTLALTAFAAVVATSAACDGPGGVDLGTNWAGSKTFVLSKVSGLVTVVGIDPGKHSAESLAVVPSQSDDDTVQAPEIAHLADGRWLVAVPRKSGKPSRLYEVNTKDHTLDGLGQVEDGRSLVPAGKVIGAVHGGSKAQPNGSVLVYDPATWNVRRTVELPIPAGIAAGGPDRVCAADSADSATRVVQATLSSGSVSAPQQIAGLQAQALDCSDGLVVAGAPTGPPATGAATVKVGRSGAATVVTSSARVDRVRSAGGSLVAAVSTPEAEQILELDRANGKELHRVSVTGFADVAGMSLSGSDWIIVSGDRGAVVNLSTGKADRFDLPGRLLAAA